ncbi:hypothetical protein PVAND_000700 [Polypedilum vanderplanki]|uniref:Tetraspanin n=1 Tax=Polypedilum vanderplanki TaxID=319348 RepID=A0A9J6BLU1_POLVA|nr:hypothetical protein PVAND_000700 [Polypedilum vanderplanki]
MTTFETLEAKMASIEQSLSYSVSSSRRKGSSSMKNYPTHSLTSNSLQKISIQKGSLERLDRKQDLKKVYVNNIEKIRNEIKSKKNSITNLKNALKKLTTHDSNDEMISDIDLRIRQAEIEFALGREEIELMELLSKLEEIKKIQMKLENDGFGPFESLYWQLSKGEQFKICAVQASSGRWNASVMPDREGLYIDWVMDGEDLQRGDLIIEINGKIINGHDKDELQKSCSNNSKCEIVVLRRNNDSKKNVNHMQTENLLRHRIAYLEEQVKELSSSHKNETHITSISIQSQPSDDNRPLIYQRGSYITTIPQTPNSSSIQKSSSTTSVNMHNYHNNHHQNDNNNIPLTPSSSTKSMKSLSASMSRISVSTDPNLQKYRREREKRDIKGSGSGSQKSAKQNENIYVRQKHSKSLGYDTDTAATYYQSSEPISTIKIRQTPPTKPQRLSLQRTKSLQEVSGLAILIAGIVVLNDVTDYSHFLEGRITAPPIMLIIAGLLIFLIAFFGCYGALKESPKLLIAFAVLLGIIFIIEIAVGIAAITFKNDLRGILNTQLSDSIRRQNKEDMMAWNLVQRRLECCGISGPRDWFEINNGTASGIPSSCCRPQYIDRETQNCLNAAPLFMDRVYREGCVNSIHDRVSSNASILIGVGIGIAFIQLMGIFLACWLAAVIKKETEA